MKSDTADVGGHEVQQVRSVEGGTMEVLDKEEIKVTSKGVVVDHGLQRTLKQRHLQMIALGGVVGSVPLDH